MQILEAHCPNHTSSQLSIVYGGANVAQNAFDQAALDLHVQRGLITTLRPKRNDPTTDSSSQLRIDLHGCQVLPGLINAHDHLGFGLFPRLGNGPYADAKAWATEIYRPDESPLRELLSVSKPTRLFWGGLRNLFSGVTTVCHHNPYDEMTFRNNFPVRVAEAYRWIHSLDFFSDTESSRRDIPANAPLQIHLGEGTGERSRQEIYELDRLGLLDQHSVLIHAVAFQSEEWALIRQRGAGVIWCPSSNLFVLGKTLETDFLSQGTPVGLGTDSPLTAEGDLLDEIRVAAGFGVPASTLYAMVTELPAGLFRLERGEGQLRPGGVADFLVVTDKGESPAERLLSLTHHDIQLVVRSGKIILASEQFVRRSGFRVPQSFQYVRSHDLDWWTSLDIHSRWNETREILGTDLFMKRTSIAVG